MFTFNSWAILCRLPNFKNFFMSVPRWRRKFAPGCTSGPFVTSFLMKSMFDLFTLSGYVKIMATCRGTATFFESEIYSVFNIYLSLIKSITWSIRKFGSGEITVRPLKSTRLPLRLPRKRPCFPFKRWQNPRVNFFGCMLSGIPLSSLFMYRAHWSWRKSQSSMIIWIRAFCILCLRIVWLRNTISVNFIVRSSSVLEI